MRKKQTLRSIAFLSACAISATLLSGCFTTTVRSGRPPAPPTVEYDEKWHSGLIYGIAELSGPYDLATICPAGWGEIKTQTSFLNGLVQLLTWGIYNPQTVTIRCATGGTTPVPPPPAAPGAAPSSTGSPTPPPAMRL